MWMMRPMLRPMGMWVWKPYAIWLVWPSSTSQRYNTYLLLPPTALSGAPRERVKARSSYVMRPHYQLHASISYMANVSIMRAASRTTKVFSGAGRSGPVLLPQSWPSWACW